MRTLWRKVLRLGRTIMELDSSPRQIAGSVALGTFVGSIPIAGIQNLTALLLAFLLRLNKVGTVLSLELYCNLLTLPFICYLDYRVGRLILGAPARTISPSYFRQLSWGKILDLARPLFLGSVVVGACVSPVAYAVALALISRRRKRAAPAVPRQVR